jgi:hypothetical protein
MCASHLHWAPCENMKSSHHLNRASWEAQWRDHNCFVSKETQLTERIAYPKPGWAARRRAYKPADPERESKSERSTLPTPFISHTYTLEPRAQPCGSSLRVAAKKPYHTLNPAVNPLQLPAHRVIVRLHDADTSGAVHTLGLPVATARCQSTLTTRGTRDSGCG